MSIDGNTAGTVALYLDLSKQQTARETLIWGLIALSVLLSTAVYALTRPMGQRLAQNINDAVAQLDAISDEASVSINEVDKLKDRIDSLPLDLLRSRDIQTQGDEHYHDTAILCIALKTCRPISRRSMSRVCRRTSHPCTGWPTAAPDFTEENSRSFGNLAWPYSSPDHSRSDHPYCAPPAAHGFYRAAVSRRKTGTTLVHAGDGDWHQRVRPR